MILHLLCKLLNFLAQSRKQHFCTILMWKIKAFDDSHASIAYFSLARHAGIRLTTRTNIAYDLVGQ